MIFPETIEEAGDAVRAHRCVLPAGGGTKPALSRVPDGVTGISLSRLSGMVEYDPAEYTFTALAGTPLAVVQSDLEKNGQYLPFDPPLAAAGATLGGTVAAGMSGPGRLRFGGVRDFVVGVRWLDGTGTVIRGGGRVVKNAAGFDFPKLFTGSMGRLGLMVELSFKVFPAPAARVTAAVECRDAADAVTAMAFLCGQPWEVEALELEVRSGSPRILVRFMGDEPALTARVQGVLAATGRGGSILPEAEAAVLWSSLANLTFGLPEAPLVKVPLTASRIAALEEALAGTGAVRHYSMAGNLAWIAGVDAAVLHPLLERARLSGVTIRGAGPLRPGLRPAALMEDKVKSAMDPNGRFPQL